MKIGDKVKHKYLQDYGFVVLCPYKSKVPGNPSEGKVLWLALQASGKIH